MEIRQLYFSEVPKGTKPFLRIFYSPFRDMYFEVTEINNLGNKVDQWKRKNPIGKGIYILEAISDFILRVRYNENEITEEKIIESIKSLKF